MTNNQNTTSKILEDIHFKMQYAIKVIWINIYIGY